MANTYTLNEGQKIRLKNKIIKGAENYKNYLENKSFLIVCEDGTEEIVRFFQLDFKHLTGLKSNLNDINFYNNCANKTISTGNIETRQKYNWTTLKSKSDRIEKIQELLYRDVKKTLLLDELVTNTHVFPVAIRNDDANICVGFVSSINKARSLRKAHSSKNVKRELKIIAILGKRNGESVFDELVYVKDTKLLLRVKQDVLKKVSLNIQLRLRENYAIYTGLNVWSRIGIPSCFRVDTYASKLKRIKLKNRLR